MATFPMETIHHHLQRWGNPPPSRSARAAARYRRGGWAFNMAVFGFMRVFAMSAIAAAAIFVEAVEEAAQR